MDDSLKNLPPKERVEALRRLQEEKKREIEELEKKREEELREAEEQVKVSLEELEDEEREAEARAKALREQLEALQEQEESLEEIVAAERAEHIPDDQYRIPQQQGPGYTPIGQIEEDLNRLLYTDNWSRRDQELYQQRKEELNQTTQYRATMGEELLDKLDTAQNIMHRLGYRH